MLLHEEVTLETQQLRCCLAALCTRASAELGRVAPMDFPPYLRRQLFELLAEWCPDGSQAVRPGQSAIPPACLPPAPPPLPSHSRTDSSQLPPRRVCTALPDLAAALAGNADLAIICEEVPMPPRRRQPSARSECTPSPRRAPCWGRDRQASL